MFQESGQVRSGTHFGFASTNLCRKFERPTCTFSPVLEQRWRPLKSQHTLDCLDEDIFFSTQRPPLSTVGFLGRHCTCELKTLSLKKRVLHHAHKEAKVLTLSELHPPCTVCNHGKRVTPAYKHAHTTWTPCLVASLVALNDTTISASVLDQFMNAVVGVACLPVDLFLAKTKNIQQTCWYFEATNSEFGAGV